MRNEPVRLYKPPKPTLADPYAQIKWMFFQVEAEYEGGSAERFRYARNKYLQYVAETSSYYPELETDKRFYLALHWEADALIRFNKWLVGQDLKSKSRYAVYKSVRQVMDMAYALRIIDNVVYHPPVFKGVSETKERSAYSESEQEVINAAIARWIDLANSVLNGYTPTGEGIPPRRQNVLPPISIDGQLCTIPEAAKQYGVKQGIIYERIRTGWTAEQAVGLAPPPPPSGFTPVQVSVEGISYSSIGAAARAYAVGQSVVAQRLRKGHTPEQSVGITPIHVLKRDERALLWMFENQFACDALAMYEDFYHRRQNLVAVCTMQRLSKLFIRWGVWPHVDDRLIMPLAAEFSMLAGLNVEALKELEIDSYQPEHRLTGQPVVRYRKRRAGSSTRSEDRELHLPLLDMEELYLDESVVQKLEKLVGLVLGLTSRIRKDAPPEIARRLFIFEDVECSQREGKRVIVAIDPKRKAGKWYRRFCTDEGLYSLFGKNFNFSLARCRPTLATNMVLAGATLFDVQIALGHESIQTTATYLDEQGLKPTFNRTVSEALERIAQRSREFQETEQAQVSRALTTPTPELDCFHETLSGCGCRNPYNPSENVRAVTKHVDGTPCRFWNMCIRCDRSIVTERTLPKLIVYRRRVNVALEADSPAIRGRKPLFEDAVQLIDGILAEDVVFPATVIRTAEHIAATMDDLLVDHLIYQGF